VNISWLARSSAASRKPKGCSIAARSPGSWRDRDDPVQQINEAYERMLKSDVRYRLVIDIEVRWLKPDKLNGPSD